MFEKELRFALSNEWAIEDFITEMTNDNETIYLLEPEEISAIQQSLPQEFKEGLWEDIKDVNKTDFNNPDFYGYAETWTNYCLISNNNDYIPIFYTENFYDYIHGIDAFLEEQERNCNDFFEFMVEFMEHYPNFIKNMEELFLKRRRNY